MSKLKGYKTIIFNVIMTLLMIIRMWGIDTDISEEDIHAGIDALEVFITFIWGVGNLVLRFVTNTPVFKKESGEASSRLVFVLLGIALFFLAVIGLHGCTGKTYTQQIVDQGGTPMQIATASFVDAESWYNNAQESFTKRVKVLPPAAANDPDVRNAVIRVNELFNKAGAVLDKWKLAASLVDMTTSQNEWTDIADQLIDAGLWMFIDDKEKLKWR